MTKQDRNAWIFLGICFAFAILFVVTTYFGYKPRPCGCVGHKSQVVPGYTVYDGADEYCLPCSELENPSTYDDIIYYEQRLLACPKETLRRYNENAKKLNDELISKGFKPHFEIYEEE